MVRFERLNRREKAHPARRNGRSMGLLLASLDGLALRLLLVEGEVVEVGSFVRVLVRV
jgi:hypothetical protein